MNRKYSLWEWGRAYLVLALWLPFFPLLMLLDGRTLPAPVLRKLLRAFDKFVTHNNMDFRIPPDPKTAAYMYRWWRLPRNWATNLYYHIVLRSDDDRANHDHPWFSFSIVLEGGYWEHTILAGGVHKREWFGPGRMKFRRSGKFAHRLVLATFVLDLTQEGEVLQEIPAKTMFLTGPVLRRWGFHHPTGFVDAYDWDAFCEANGIKNLTRMDGGSDGVASSRNKHNFN